MPLNQSTPPEWIIKISGRSFSKGIEFNITESISSKTTGIIKVDLNINPEFRNVDFKDQIEIYLDKKPRFLGIIENYQFNDKIGIIHFEDVRLRLENETISAEFMGMNHLEIFALIIQSSGIILNPKQQSQLNVERNFFIIIPVQNLESKNSFEIGDVRFYHKFDNIDDLTDLSQERLQIPE